MAEGSQKTQFFARRTRPSDPPAVGKSPPLVGLPDPLGRRLRAPQLAASPNGPLAVAALRAPRPAEGLCSDRDQSSERSALAAEVDHGVTVRAHNGQVFYLGLLSIARSLPEGQPVMDLCISHAQATAAFTTLTIS
jgi:hypothetical protein